MRVIVEGGGGRGVLGVRGISDTAVSLNCREGIQNGAGCAFSIISTLVSSVSTV